MNEYLFEMLLIFILHLGLVFLLVLMRKELRPIVRKAWFFYLIAELAFLEGLWLLMYLGKVG